MIHPIPNTISLYIHRQSFQLLATQFRFAPLRLFCHGPSNFAGTFDLVAEEVVAATRYVLISSMIRGFSTFTLLDGRVIWSKSH